MNPEDNTDPYAGEADNLRQNTQNSQIAEYTAKEQNRLQGTRLKKLASFKKNRGGPAEPQLTLSTFALMFLVAIFIDAISIGMNFIPAIGGLLEDITIAPAATLIFFIWLKMHGINFTKGPRGLFFILTIIIGFIPIVNAIPEWTFFVCGLYFSGTKLSTGMQKTLNKVKGK